jgi:hypothetical protein
LHVQYAHLAKHKNGPGEGLFACDKCEFICKTKNTLNKHLAVKHDGASVNRKKTVVYDCSECGKLSTSKLYHMQHTYVEHNIRLPGLKEFTCNYCNKVLYVEKTFKDHLAGHTREKKHVCKFCPYSTNISANLSKHEKLVHKVEKSRSRLNWSVFCCIFVQLYFPANYSNCSVIQTSLIFLFLAYWENEFIIEIVHDYFIQCSYYFTCWHWDSKNNLLDLLSSFELF